uniref:Uncharacterized protein n=1 Tax=Panagrolaimus sp. ES5 TaxID=591445 RepID=A0AC34G6B9_9BILA
RKKRKVHFKKNIE